MATSTRPYTLGAREVAMRETRVRILESAHALWRERWHDEVTLADVAAGAGVSVQTVVNHFGGKDALIAALVEWLDHDDSVRLVAQLKEERDRRARLDLLVQLQREGCTSHEENQLFFDLLPHVLRDPRMRERLAELYEWYRELDGWVLAPEGDARRDDVRLLAALAIAVGDGLTIQCAVDRTFDVDAVYELWERLFRIALDEVSQGEHRRKKSE
jgi:AcrR family transcriptional regulator